GNEKNPDPNDTNVFRYSGEYFDKETGTIYLRARYYNPYIGRFISEDTYKGTINDPLSLNYYIYCAGNPINYIDPSGHKREGVTERRPHERSRQTNAYQPVGKGMSFNITVGGAEVGVEVIWYNADAFDVKNLPTYRYNEKDYKFNFDEPVVYIYSGVDLGNDLGKVIANSLEGMKNIKKGTNWAASANGYLVHVMGHKVNFKSPVDYTGPFNYGTVTAKHISGTLAFDNMAKVYTMGVGISKSPVGFGFGRNYYYLLPQHLTIEFTEKLFQLLETIEEP
ncbi:RHS repeat-associated core domain-containing protein, partial [Alkaliphilus serpentinus]